MPSGVSQVNFSRSPLTSFAANASQSARVGRSVSPIPKGYDDGFPGRKSGGESFSSARLRQLLGGGRLFERASSGGHSGAADGTGAGVEVPVAPFRRTARRCRRADAPPDCRTGRRRRVDQTELRAHIMSIPAGYDSYSGECSGDAIPGPRRLFAVSTVGTYLDHAASTPMRTEALAAMQPFLEDSFGNPSGSHAAARSAKTALEAAREEIADLLGARPAEVVFTGGGTEADNLAVKGAARAARERADRLDTVVVGAFEHKGVLAAADRLQ